jgi:hexosaminidase
MVDLSRHFLPLPSLTHLLTSMSYAKLNVLHLHLSDSQAFPLQSHTYPHLWQGSYSLNERYTQDDMRVVVEEARRRGR